MSDYTATYSPDDNKLRLYSVGRLPADLYERVKSAGFRWAPKQDLFVAPSWTPEREDLLLELADEITDEDTSLVDRAEQRAERFEEYSEHRAQDAAAARKAVDAITDGIPLGQPILVGHHSERHARKDAQRIENGMRKAVDMWKTSKYWTSRAAGAIQHAKYKERPDVRARRIKTIGADLRKEQRRAEAAENMLKLWTTGTLTLTQARFIAGHTASGHVTVVSEGGHNWSAYDVLRPDEDRYKACPSKTVEDVQQAARETHARITASCTRWIEHYQNRLAYETAMLDEQGAAHLLEKKPRPAQLPICNYRSPGGIAVIDKWHRGEASYYPQIEMTQAQYADIYHEYKGTEVVGHSHRVRVAIVKGARSCVFITDSKTHEPIPPIEPKPRTPRPSVPFSETQPRPEPTQTDKDMAAMSETLKKGVQVVVTPQLFPTPHDIAQQLADLADIQKDSRILEPSAGTGALLNAITQPHGPITAIEINVTLADRLRQTQGSDVTVDCVDFLSLKMEGSPVYDRVLMNPPFENGADIKHIRHAITFLKPGGRLVAICANGPRQREALQPISYDWIELPEGSFKEQGTNVRTAIVIIDKWEHLLKADEIEEFMKNPAIEAANTQAAADRDDLTQNDIDSGAWTETPNSQGFKVEFMGGISLNKPMLGQDAKEAERLTYANRPIHHLRQAKTFDSQPKGSLFSKPQGSLFGE